MPSLHTRQGADTWRKLEIGNWLIEVCYDSHTCRRIDANFMDVENGSF